MEFQDVIRKRRMVRHFTSEPIDQEVIHRILQVALKAPSAGFTQGQSFVVVTRADLRKRLGQLLGEEDEEYPEGEYPWVSEAPVLVVPCISEAAYHRRYQEADKRREDGSEMDWPYPFWHMDMGCSVMLLLLAVVNEGLAASFAGVFVKELTSFRELLHLPEEVLPAGVIAIGHPGHYPPPTRLKSRRKPENELIYYEQWGGDRSR